MATAAIVAARAMQAKKKPAENSTDDSVLLQQAIEENALPDYRNPEKFSGIAKSYIELSLKVHDFTAGDPFNNFILVVIVAAGLLVGIQTDDALAVDPGVIGTDMVILVIFIIECFLKALAEGSRPWMYFCNKEYLWNCFDFTIVFLCLPFWNEYLGDNAGAIALLRLMRLMRVMKIVKKIPQLQMIIMGLAGGMKSIGYILVLLLLVFYLFAIVGMFIFRSNDPWHFGDLFTTLLTLFRCSTLEDWTDVMYINIYGCASDMYDSGIYTTSNVTANGVGLIYCPPSSSNSQPVVAIIYFLVFICISALVMLSLFIGAVTMSMTESMESMKAEAFEAERGKQLLKAQEKAEKEAQEMAKQGERQGSANSINSNQSDEDDEKEQMEQLKLVLLSAWNGVDLMTLLNQSQGNKSEMIENTFLRMYYNLSVFCKNIAEANWFVNGVTGVICACGVVVGIQTYPNTEMASCTENCELATVLFILNWVISTIFTIEVVLKIIAEYDRPSRYFIIRGRMQRWNVFDFVVVAGGYLPAGGDLIVMLRLLRLLRVLKLVKSLPELQVIVVALIDGIGSIGYIAIILVLFFYVFAIIGMIVFKKNDPWHFGTLPYAMLSLFRASTLEDWTDIMYINMYGCVNYGYDVAQPIPAANATLPGTNISYWPTPMGCDIKHSYGHGAWAALYFVFFCLVGALVLMTLFIGVVTTSMEEASSKQKEEAEVLERVKEIQEKEGLTADSVKMYTMCFNLIDIDNGGTIDEEELRIALKSIGKVPKEAEMEDMMGAVDEDGSGEIDLAEFVQFMVNLQNRESEKKKEQDENIEETSDADDSQKNNKAGQAWNQYMDNLAEEHDKKTKEVQRKVEERKKASQRSPQKKYKPESEDSPKVAPA